MRAWGDAITENTEEQEWKTNHAMISMTPPAAVEGSWLLRERYLATLVPHRGTELFKCVFHEMDGWMGMWQVVSSPSLGIWAW